MIPQNASILPAAPKKPSAVMRFFSNPIVGILGALASIISVPLAIYFFAQTTQFRELVYYVNPAQAIVVKAGEVSKLRVLIGDRELKSDVTTAQIAIWNRGNESLKPENVLVPALIRTVPSVPILEAKIRTKSRDAIGFALDESHLEEGIVGLSWKILEQGDGAVIQMVYAGNPDATKINVSGVIEGQHEIRRIQYSGKILSGVEQMRQEQRPWFIWLSLGFGILIIVQGVILFREKGERFALVLFLVLGIAQIAIFLWGFLSRTPNPPFGF